MILKKTKYSTNFWLNKYLSNFDLLYKYKIKTLYKLPQIKNIILSLPLNKISYLNGIKNKITSTPAQRIIFIFLFSIFTITPFIKSNSLPAIQRTLKGNPNNFSLILTFFTEKQIESFIFYFFIEIWLILIKNGYKLYFKKPFFLIKNGFSELNLKIPLSIFQNFNILFNSVNNQLIKEEATFFLTFKFKNLIFLNKKKCIKNLQFFWKNN